MKKVLFLLIFVVLSLIACSEDNGQQEEEQAERETPVEIGEVTKGSLTMERSFYGRTMPDQSTPVIPSVAGEIDELEVENGEEVEEDQDIATIKSPQGTITVEAAEAGIVTQLEAQEGSMVSNQEPLAVIIDTDQLNVQLQVPDTQLDLFNEEEAITLTFPSAEENLEAEIDYIADTSGETGLFQVDVSFDNEETQYKAGIVAQAALEETVVEDAILIPTEALVETNEEAYVFVAEEGTAKRVDITVVDMQSEQTAVEGELSEGDQVITSGQLILTDGSKINVIEED